MTMIQLQPELYIPASAVKCIHLVYEPYGGYAVKVDYGSGIHYIPAETQKEGMEILTRLVGDIRGDSGVLDWSFGVIE